MNFQIVKGWPSAGALDQKYTIKANEAVVPGKVVMLETDGTVSLTASADNGVAVYGVCFDTDVMDTGKVMVLHGQFVIETDDVTLTDLAPGDAVMSDASGTFVEATGVKQVIGKVLSVTATKARILWTAN